MVRVVCGAAEMTWRLKRTRQCEKCPWRVETDPRTIPNGYSEEKHRALRSTIANGPDLSAIVGRTPLHAMACHEGHEDYCVGWLVNQLGPGNNIALRMRMLTCENANKIRLCGEQHERFEDTLP